MISSDAGIRQSGLYRSTEDAVIVELRQVNAELSQKIQILDNNTERRFEVLTLQVQNNFDYQNMRMESIQTSVYWGFALITFFIAVVGVMVALAPSILEIFRSRRKERDYVTSEQVQEIVDRSISKALDKASMI